MDKSNMTFLDFQYEGIKGAIGSSIGGVENLSRMEWYGDNKVILHCKDGKKFTLKIEQNED